eukprot:scaffold2037_cov149-Isochrysis_galbana.AAC.4
MRGESERVKAGVGRWRWGAASLGSVVGLRSVGEDMSLDVSESVARAALAPITPFSYVHCFSGCHRRTRLRLRPSAPNSLRLRRSTVGGSWGPCGGCRAALYGYGLERAPFGADRDVGRPGWALGATLGSEISPGIVPRLPQPVLRAQSPSLARSTALSVMPFRRRRRRPPDRTRLKSVWRRALVGV